MQPVRKPPRPELLAELEILRQRLADTASRPAFIESSWLRGAEQDERVLRILRNLRAVVTEIDETGRIVYVSPSSEQVTGHRPDELVGHFTWESIHEDDLEELARVSQAIGEGKAPARVRYRTRHRDGGWIWTEVESGVRFEAPDGTLHTVHVNRDVTEMKAAEDALRESEERYRAVAEHSLDVIAESDHTGRMTYMSEAAEQVFRAPREQLLRTTPFSLIHPDDRPRVIEQFTSGFESGETTSIEAFRVQRQDGSWLWYEVTGITYRRADGQQRFLAVGRDVTERLRREEERKLLDERMQQAQRLESLGVMAGGIAHDFNNLLTPILGGAGLALLDLPADAADSPLRGHLLRIQRAAQRAAQLTEQMLTYAGVGSLELAAVDVSAQVEEMGRLLETAISGKTRLVYELDPDLPRVRADPSQLGQAVMNLITNAAEAVGDGAGRIAIRTGREDATEATRTSRWIGGPLPPGPYVFVEVEDTGCGIDAGTRRRIFDPFFTTKFTGRGLGLAAVLGFVRGHGGAIELESEPGRGTRFRILLPADPSGARSRIEAGAEPTCDASWHCDGTVLLADDDEAVRQLVEDTLRRVGAAVLCAADGGEAVELFRKHEARIRLVILDRTMPSTSGEDAFQAIRARRPDVPVILISGYSRARATSALTAQGLTGFLKKPFTPGALLDTVRAHLEPGGA